MNPTDSSDDVSFGQRPGWSWKWFVTILYWLPFATLAICLLSWWELESILKRPSHGLLGVGNAIGIGITLGIWNCAGIGGAILAFILFIAERVRNKSYSKGLLSAVILNLLVGPVLIYGVETWKYYENVPLIVRAVDNEDTAQLNLILGSTEDPANPSTDATVAFTRALGHDHYESIEAIVDYFVAAPGWGFSIESAICNATYHRHPETAGRLWNKGISANAKAPLDLDRLVCLAADSGLSSLLRKALEAGGNPSAVLGNKSALNRAAAPGNSFNRDCVELLLEFGFKPSSVAEVGSLIDVAIRSNDLGQTQDFMDYLEGKSLEDAPDLGSRLLKSAYQNDSSNQLQILEILLNAGADPALPTAGKSTALGMAISDNNIEAVRLFVEYGADLNDPRIGYSLVESAKRYGYEDMAMLLIDLGANVTGPE